MQKKNVLVLSKEGIDARVEFIISFLSTIKDKAPGLLPTLLGLECQNEAYMRADLWPFTEKAGTYTAANGKTYDLSKTDQRQALMDEGYRHYHRQIVNAVKRIDPRMLVPHFDWLPDQDHGGNLLMGLQTMILQADDAKIRLLPAWPKNWHLDFKLHAPHKTTVQGIVRNGTLVDLRGTPESCRKDIINHYN